MIIVLVLKGTRDSPDVRSVYDWVREVQSKPGGFPRYCSRAAAPALHSESELETAVLSPRTARNMLFALTPKYLDLLTAILIIVGHPQREH